MLNMEGTRLPPRKEHPLLLYWTRAPFRLGRMPRREGTLLRISSFQAFFLFGFRVAEWAKDWDQTVSG